MNPHLKVITAFMLGRNKPYDIKEQGTGYQVTSDGILIDIPRRNYVRVTLNGFEPKSFRSQYEAVAWVVETLGVK